MSKPIKTDSNFILTFCKECCVWCSTIKCRKVWNAINQIDVPGEMEEMHDMCIISKKSCFILFNEGGYFPEM